MVQLDLVLPVDCTEELERFREGKPGELKEKGKIVVFRTARGGRLHHSEVMSRVLKRSESCDGNEVCTSTTKSPKREGEVAAYKLHIYCILDVFCLNLN